MGSDRASPLFLVHMRNDHRFERRGCLISPASPLCPDSDLIAALLWPALFQVNLVHYLSSLIRDNYTLSRNGEPPVT